MRRPRAPASLALCRQAELGSADRRQAKLGFAKRGPCGPILSASVTSQLSLFTLQSTPASQSELQRCSLLRQNAGGASRRNRVSPAGWSQPGLRPWCLSAQPGCACRPAKRCFAGGGGERIRTDDLLLAKQALSQLSYTPLSGTRSQVSGTRHILIPGAWLLIPGWWAREDLNLRPHAYQARALTS